jgi:hypothetical protein
MLFLAERDNLLLSIVRSLMNHKEFMARNFIPSFAL